METFNQSVSDCAAQIPVGILVGGGLSGAIGMIIFPAAVTQPPAGAQARAGRSPQATLLS